MAIYIPGADTLGYTLDVFGRYSSDSRMKPIFEMDYGDKTWKEYIIPSNITIDSSTKNYGEANSFKSRQKFEEHFGLKIGMKAGYGFFSAEFEGSFNMTTRSDISYEYGMVEMYSRNFSIELKNATESELAPWVKSDPYYNEIPEEFTNENRELFFRFLEKYGLFFVAGVTLGARLYYSIAVSSSQHYSEKEIKTKLEMEYKAVFSGSVNSEAEWKKVGESWASSREVKVSATGGNNSILNVLVPGYEANHSEAFKAWLESADANPAAIDFKMRPIEEIFSGKKAAAMKKAVKEYLRHRLFTESKTGSCLIYFDNRTVLPQPTGEYKNYGFQLVAIDRVSLKAVFKKSFATYDYWSGYQPIYDEMLKEITPFNNNKHIIVFTTYSNFALTAPPRDFAAFLANCGAETELMTWLDTKASNMHSCALAHINYSMVGIPGSEPGTAHERFERAGSCDTGSYHWSPSYGWLGLPAPSISLNVDLYMVINTEVHSKKLSARLALPKSYRPSGKQAQKKLIKKRGASASKHLQVS